MANVGDIIEIPYQEGGCTRCGWTVTRDDGGEPWSGQLGGDCRADDEGVHHVAAAVWLKRRARIAEGIMTTVVIMNDDKVIMRQQFPGDAGWQETWPEPREFTQIDIRHHKYRYSAAVDDTTNSSRAAASDEA